MLPYNPKTAGESSQQTHSTREYKLFLNLKFTQLLGAKLSKIDKVQTEGQYNDMANQILKENFERLVENEAGVRIGLNLEALHNMRVATRRLRAAIKIFQRILPSKAQKIRTELQKLGRMLGKKRDFDIFSEFIFHTVNTKSISFLKLARRRNQLQKQILTMLESKYYASLIEMLVQLKTVTTKKNILKVSLNRIRKELYKVLEIGLTIDSQVDDTTLHKLRIAIKKLRYICEFFEPIFSKCICPLGAFIEKTKEIQDLLGNHQDVIMGISMLMHYRSKFSEDEFLQITKKYGLKKIRTRKLFLTTWKQYLETLAKG